jgi:hypothetical protein
MCPNSYIKSESNLKRPRSEDQGKISSKRPRTIKNEIITWEATHQANTSRRQQKDNKTREFQPPIVVSEPKKNVHKIGKGNIGAFEILQPSGHRRTSKSEPKEKKIDENKENLLRLVYAEMPPVEAVYLGVKNEAGISERTNEKRAGGNDRNTLANFQRRDSAIANRCLAKSAQQNIPQYIQPNILQNDQPNILQNNQEMPNFQLQHGSSGVPIAGPSQVPDSAYNSRQRAVIRPEHVAMFTEIFKTNQYPDKMERTRLGKLSNLTPRQVQIWFQNTRSNTKKAKKAEKADNSENTTVQGCEITNC